MEMSWELIDPGTYQMTHISRRRHPSPVVLRGIHRQLKKFHQAGTAKFAHDPGGRKKSTREKTGETQNFAMKFS